jgi:uncharacterized membrane protein (DUF485 family)
VKNEQYIQKHNIFKLKIIKKTKEVFSMKGEKSAKTQKSVSKKPAGKYFRAVKKKEHEAGWMALFNIGIVAFIVFVALALIFGYAKTLTMGTILMNGIWTAVLVVVVVVFIVGLITVSENTAKEMKPKAK